MARMLYGNLYDTWKQNAVVFSCVCVCVCLVVSSVKCQADDYRHCCEIGNLTTEKKRKRNKLLQKPLFRFAFVEFVCVLSPNWLSSPLFPCEVYNIDTSMSNFRTKNFKQREQNKAAQIRKTCSCILLTDYMTVLTPTFKIIESNSVSLIKRYLIWNTRRDRYRSNVGDGEKWDRQTPMCHRETATRQRQRRRKHVCNLG